MSSKFILTFAFFGSETQNKSKNSCTLKSPLVQQQLLQVRIVNTTDGIQLLKFNASGSILSKGRITILHNNKVHG